MKRTPKSRPRKAKPEVTETLPSIYESEFLHLARTLLEHYEWRALIENSYVLSRFWAWLTQVRVSPEVRIPMPRFLTYRDP